MVDLVFGVNFVLLNWLLFVGFFFDVFFCFLCFVLLFFLYSFGYNGFVLFVDCKIIFFYGFLVFLLGDCLGFVYCFGDVIDFGVFGKCLRL